MYTEVDAIIQLIWPYSTEVDDLKLAIIRVRVRNLNYYSADLAIHTLLKYSYLLNSSSPSNDRSLENFLRN